MHRVRLASLLLALCGGDSLAAQLVPPRVEDASREDSAAHDEDEDAREDEDDADLARHASLARRLLRHDGSTRRLIGPVPTSGDDLLARADDFVARHGAEFGMDADTRLDVHDVGRAASQRVRFVQHVHGHRLVGHALDVDFDESGAVRGAHGVLAGGLGGVSPPALDADAARALALSAAGLTRDDLAAAPDVVPIARLTADGLQLVQRVEVVRADRMPLAVELDADDGALLRIVLNGVHGGIFHYDDEDVSFPLASGKAAAYRSVKAAMTAADTSATLKGLAGVDVDDVVFAGTLTGRFSQVVDADGLQLFSAQNDFSFADDGFTLLGGVPEYQLFDHANAYSWLDRAGMWFAKRLGAFEGATSLLTYVNFDDGGEGYANAFYSPVDPDGPGGFDAGYLVFGDFTAVTGDPMHDMSRDPSIVCHEYTHMVVDKAGALFGQEDYDTAPRAVNEALADYAAASLLKDPYLGRALLVHAAEALGMQGSVAFRDLTSEVTLPDDLWREMGLSGFPQEHIAGEIFGSALWSVRKALKAKLADAAIFGSLSAWPFSNAEVGHPVVDLDNVDASYAAFYYACAEALLDGLVAPGTPKGGLAAGKALGAFLRHGIAGTSPETTYGFDGTAGLRLAFESAFLGSLDVHTFTVHLAAGQTLSVVATGVGGTTVDFDLGDEPGDLEPGLGKKTNAAGTQSSQAKMTVLNGGTYTVTLTDTSGQGGRYRFVLKAK